ncbi:unnamed protein product [Calypogeia fissa]
MAMAAVSTTSSWAIGHLWTKRQLKRGFWVGKNSRCSLVASFHPDSSYISSTGSNSIRFVVLGKGFFSKNSCSCGGIGRGFRVVQGRGSKRWESDRRWRSAARNQSTGGGDDEESDEVKRDEDEEVDQALNLDGQIPTTSDGFLKQVSSNAYDLRRQLEQNIESSSYDVLESNPWRETPKPVYVLAQEENRLLTMRTRRARSEVERELGMLFPKRGSRRGRQTRQGRPSSKSREEESNSSSSETGFRMLVEDIREGVLVFEDEEEATRYCSLLDGQGQNCAGVAELDASDVFAVCQKTQRLAVLFRRGTTPPQPDRLQLNLKARKRSLED